VPQSRTRSPGASRSCTARSIARVVAWRPLPNDAPSPESLAIAAEERDRQEVALDAVAAAMARLPGDARTYLQHRFMGDPPLPPRRIAELMRLPIEELYRRRRGWENLLRAELERLGIDKFSEPSV